MSYVLVILHDNRLSLWHPSVVWSIHKIVGRLHRTLVMFIQHLENLLHPLHGSTQTTELCFRILLQDSLLMDRAGSVRVVTDADNDVAVKTFPSVCLND